MIRYTLLMALFVSASVANGAFTVQTINEFTGSDFQVKVTLFDDGEVGVASGNIKVKAEVVDSITGNTGDLRGIWLDISDDSLLAGLSVVESVGSVGDVIQTAIIGPANSVNSVGSPSNNLNGGGTPQPLDMGFEIGTQGIGMGDDFQMAMFTLSHNTINLGLSLFANQELAARAQSVGPAGGSRGGSSKLGGSFTPMDPVPEPASLAVWSLGCAVCCLGARRRRR